MWLLLFKLFFLATTKSKDMNVTKYFPYADMQYTYMYIRVERSSKIWSALNSDVFKSYFVL